MSKELEIVRVFDAPRSIVWSAWTSPETFKKWWGPMDFTCPLCEIDLRVDGRYLLCMQDPKGNKIFSTGYFKEIIPLEKIVFTDSFSDENGNIVPASYYGMDRNIPLELNVIVEFEDHKEKTKMALRHIGLPHDGFFDMTKASWNKSFDKLNEIIK